jgi:hypothetical protein
MRATRYFAAPLLLLILALDSANAQADPTFAMWPFNIRPDPTPGIVGDVNDIHVTAFNGGNADTTNLEIVLSYNDWGVTYMGWQEIGRANIASLDAQNYAERTLQHVFNNRAHICLEAKYSSTGVGTGGNTNTWNDRTQINWEVVYADESTYVYVPFGNGADEDIVVNGTEIVCLLNGTEVPCDGGYSGGGGGGGVNERDCYDESPDTADGEICCISILGQSVPCCNDELMQDATIGDNATCCDGELGRVFCEDNQGRRRSFTNSKGRRAGDLGDFVQTPPSLINAPATLAANSEQVAVLKVPEIADNGMTVMVNANMNGQYNNVMIQVVKITIEELFNTPMFCCIKSIKIRVMLETMLAEAMEAWEQGMCKKAIKILRQLLQKMILLLCDMDKEEKACIEKALLRINDLTRLISIRCCGADPLGSEIREGDFFRRAGLYEAAALEYAQAC